MDKSKLLSNSRSKLYLYECQRCGQRTRTDALDIKLMYEGYRVVYDGREFIKYARSCPVSFDRSARHEFERVR